MDDNLYNVMCWALQNTDLKLMEAKFNKEDKKKYYTLIGESKAYMAVVDRIAEITGHGKTGLNEIGCDCCEK